MRTTIFFLKPRGEGAPTAVPAQHVADFRQAVVNRRAMDTAGSDVFQMRNSPTEIRPRQHTRSLLKNRRRIAGAGAPKFDIDAGLDAKIKSELFINSVNYAFFQALIL